MKIIKLNCSNCNGFAEVKNENGQKIVFCPYCGQKYLVDDEKIYTEININKTERKIDEARIKEAEVREKIRLKELELKIEEKKSKREVSNKLIKTLISIILASIGVFALFMAAAHLSYGGTNKSFPFLVIGLLMIGVLWLLWKKK